MPDVWEDDVRAEDWKTLVDIGLAAERDANAMAPDDEQPGDPVGLAKLLANMRLAMQELAAAAQYVENTLAIAMVDKTMTVEGIGEVERHTGASRKEWDTESLLGVVEMAVATTVLGDMEGLLVDTDTGEAVDLVTMTHDIITEFRKAATPSWKVTGLRAMHVDPNNYCTTTWGRKTVQMPKLEKFLED